MVKHHTVVLQSIRPDLRNKKTNPEDKVNLTLYMPLRVRERLRAIAIKRQSNMTEILMEHISNLIAAEEKEEAE